jgi:hypothetical protein
MPDSKPWTYKNTLKSSHPSAPSLVVVAGTSITASQNTLLASSSIQMRVRVQVDDEELPGDELRAGALIKEVQEWLEQVRSSPSTLSTQRPDRPAVQNKASIGIDSVGEPQVAQNGVTSRLLPYEAPSFSSTLC